jgi:hypothetical protein
VYGQGSVPGRAGDASLFRLWDPPGLLSYACLELFPLEQSGKGMRLTVHVRLVQKPGIVELYRHSSARLHGVVLN